MIQDNPRLKEVFKQPPLIAYKRNRNLKDKLIRSKVPNLNRRRSKRQLKGMKKCGKCSTCPFVKEGNRIKSTKTNFSKEISSSVDCSDKNVIYLIECTKNNCQEQYVGSTEQDFRTRMSQHRGYVNNQKLEKATGYHFTQKNHQLSDMKMSIIEKIHKKDRFYLLEREKYFIRKFNTKYLGINRNC